MQMLQKAGWQAGEGLGAKQQGITTPLPAWHQAGREGLGAQQPADTPQIDGPSSKPAGAARAAPGGPAFPPRSVASKNVGLEVSCSSSLPSLYCISKNAHSHDTLPPVATNLLPLACAITPPILCWSCQDAAHCSSLELCTLSDVTSMHWAALPGGLYCLIMIPSGDEVRAKCALRISRTALLDSGLPLRLCDDCCASDGRDLGESEHLECLYMGISFVITPACLCTNIAFLKSASPAIYT